MKRIYSNGRSNDYVIRAFQDLIETSNRLYFAAPYFTYAEPVLEAIEAGKSVRLLVGLNATTSPEQLKILHGLPNVAIRYLTNRFHAKIYIFDNAALLGSSNLTNRGFWSNREAVICLDLPEDAPAIDEIRSLFLELWDSARVLTSDVLKIFAKAKKSLGNVAFRDLDVEIEEAVGKAEPPNINVTSRIVSKEREFIERLRRTVFEEYRPAFSEVSALLDKHDLRRSDLADLGPDNETNRFLNYLRTTHVIGDEAWQSAPLRSPRDRRMLILRFGHEWLEATDNKVPADYFDRLKNVVEIFGTPTHLSKASKDEIITGLMSIHAFAEQFRFVHGGWEELPNKFWEQNDNNLDRVKNTLSHLIYGPEDFISRLHDVLYNPSMKLGLFGYFCSLELYGTVEPNECPPMNGRMAKALRYLGFDVAVH